MQEKEAGPEPILGALPPVYQPIQNFTTLWVLFQFWYIALSLARIKASKRAGKQHEFGSTLEVQ